MRLPDNDTELVEAGEWAEQLVLSAGGSPITAFKVAAVWVEGLTDLMQQHVEDWEL